MEKSTCSASASKQGALGRPLPACQMPEEIVGPGDQAWREGGLAIVKSPARTSLGHKNCCFAGSNDKTITMKSQLDLSQIDTIVQQHGTRREAVIPDSAGHPAAVPIFAANALKRVCQLTEITPADITGVSTFYTHFRHQPVGKHTVHVCQGTACHVKGSELVQDAITQHLGIPKGKDTDPRGEFTVESVACLGCCTLAPVIQVDQTTFGRVTPRSVPQVIAESLAGSASAGRTGPVG